MSDTESIYYHAAKQLMKTDKLHRMALDHAIGKIGLHRSQHMLLMYLYRGGDASRQRALADAMEISPAAVTGLIQKLEREGYVERVPSPEDARNNITRLTQKGISVLEESMELFHTVDRRMFEGLSEEDLIGFVRCLDILQINCTSYLSADK